jgi:hypothetical protein
MKSSGWKKILMHAYAEKALADKDAYSLETLCEENNVDVGKLWEDHIMKSWYSRNGQSSEISAAWTIHQAGSHSFARGPGVIEGDKRPVCDVCGTKWPQYPGVYTLPRNMKFIACNMCVMSITYRLKDLKKQEKEDGE